MEGDTKCMFWFVLLYAVIVCDDVDEVVNPDAFDRLGLCLGTVPTEDNKVFANVMKERISFWHRGYHKSCFGQHPDVIVRQACTRFDFECDDTGGNEIWKEIWRIKCESVDYEYEYIRNGKKISGTTINFWNHIESGGTKQDRGVARHLFGVFDNNIAMKVDIEEKDYAMFLSLESNLKYIPLSYLTNAPTCNETGAVLGILFAGYLLILVLVLLRITFPGRCVGHTEPWPTFLPEPAPAVKQLIYRKEEKKKPYKPPLHKKGVKWAKIWQYLATETAFLGVFFADWDHPFTPDERAITLFCRHAQLAFASTFIGSNKRSQRNENFFTSFVTVSVSSTILGALFAIATVSIPSQILKKDWKRQKSHKRYFLWGARLWFVAWTICCLILWFLWLPGWGAVAELLSSIFLDGFVFEPLLKGSWYLFRRFACGLEKHSINVDALVKKGVVSPLQGAIADTAQKDGEPDEQTQRILEIIPGEPNTGTSRQMLKKLFKYAAPSSRPIQTRRRGNDNFGVIGTPPLSPYGGLAIPSALGMAAGGFGGNVARNHRLRDPRRTPIAPFISQAHDASTFSNITIPELPLSLYSYPHDEQQEGDEEDEEGGEEEDQQYQSSTAIDYYPEYSQYDEHENSWEFDNEEQHHQDSEVSCNGNPLESHHTSSTSPDAKYSSGGHNYENQPVYGYAYW